VRWMIMHKTNAHWEAGANPSPEMIQRVGALMGELQNQGSLLGAEGLRATSQGLRLSFAGGRSVQTPGPYSGQNELLASFAILRVPSADEAVAWARRYADIVGDVEADVRPVTEAWDIGLVPAPAEVATRRWMVLFKATSANEAGTPLDLEHATALQKLIDATRQSGELLTIERLLPSRSGVRLRRVGRRIRVTDGPFAESKEFIAGYVLVSLATGSEAVALAERYANDVEAEEVDLRRVATQDSWLEFSSG
jgi:hypothetical protein